ncbi:MAG: DUF4358 domain-containing protein [Candidatus Heteroscillospira sp.]|jgi:hypothetical protein
MKKSLSLFLLLALMCLLCACGSGSHTDFAPADLTAELLDSSCFTDLLSKMETDTALELYGLDESDVSDCSIYLGTGATAEEIAVFKAADEDAAAKIAEAMDARVTGQISAYESYVPAEVPKLEKAIVRSSGVYVAYVTAADADGAVKIIDKYMK